MRAKSSWLSFEVGSKTEVSWSRFSNARVKSGSICSEFASSTAKEATAGAWLGESVTVSCPVLCQYDVVQDTRLRFVMRIEELGSNWPLTMPSRRKPLSALQVCTENVLP